MKNTTAFFISVWTATLLLVSMSGVYAQAPGQLENRRAIPGFDPADALALGYQGRLEKQADRDFYVGDWQLAEKEYEEVLAVKFKDPGLSFWHEPLYGLGQCMAHQGDYKGAIECYQKALYNLAPGHVPSPDGFNTQNPVPILEYALLLLKSGDFGDAIPIYNEGVRITNEIAGSKAHVIWPNVSDGHYPAEMDCTAANVEGVLHAMLSYHNYVRHGPDAGDAELDLARTLAPNVAEVHLWYGYSYLPTKDKPLDRKTEFEAAIKLDKRGVTAPLAKEYLDAFCR